MRKKAIISVTNDISTDQRVFKYCQSLIDMHFEIEVIGRLQPWSKELSRNYPCRRIKTFFVGGPLFYLEFNLRLFFLLCFKPADLLVSNDLDTLLANYFASKVKNCTLLYDSHELFPEGPELIQKPFKKQMWRRIEAFLLPKLQLATTVCQSISTYYHKKYGLEMKVLRNVPYLVQKKIVKTSSKTIIYQGNMNPGRGLELAIKSLTYLPNFNLKIIGDGSGLNELKKLAFQEKLDAQVEFLGRLPFEELREHTQTADIGLLLEEPLGLSFEYSLPNKLFDYIHAHTPVIATPLVEVKAIIDQYPIGELIKVRHPESVAQQIKEMISKISTYDFEKAKKDLNWQKEQEVLKLVIPAFLRK